MVIVVVCQSHCKEVWVVFNVMGSVVSCWASGGMFGHRCLGIKTAPSTRWAWARVRTIAVLSCIMILKGVNCYTTV